MSMTVREVQKALSHEHPDAPVVVRLERLFYDKNGQIVSKDTEIESVDVSAVRPLLDGRVEIG